MGGTFQGIADGEQSMCKGRYYFQKESLVYADFDILTSFVNRPVLRWEYNIELFQSNHGITEGGLLPIW